MTKRKPILTAAEMHALICGNPSTLGLSVARLKDFIRQVEKAVVAKLAEQEPVAWRITAKRFCGEFTHDRSIAQHWIESKPESVTPLYAHPMPNGQVNLGNSNHIPNASKMLTPLAHRKIQSKLAEGYRKIENATVLVNEHGRAAIVNHGGAFYWVENSALAREYDGRPIPVNSCRPTETNKKGANE